MTWMVEVGMAVGAPLGANSGAGGDPMFAAKAAPTGGGGLFVGASSGANKKTGANRQQPFHGGDLRKGRYSQAGQIYLVTTVTHDREKLFGFAPEGAPTMMDNLLFANARAVIHAMRLTSQRKMAQTLLYVLMPDHLHWLMSLEDGFDLSTTVAQMKGVSARRINQSLKRHDIPVWQRGFHDHAVRAEEDIRDMARYVVANPLRAGLVEHLGDYPWWDAVWL